MSLSHGSKAWRPLTTGVRVMSGWLCQIVKQSQGTLRVVEGHEMRQKMVEDGSSSAVVEKGG